MPRVKKIAGEDGTAYRYFDCPGCGRGKVLPISGARAWGYNGNDDFPTFSPSILQRWFEGEESGICHSFVRSGRIEFLNDCTHALSDKTVDLPEVE